MGLHFPGVCAPPKCQLRWVNGCDGTHFGAMFSSGGDNAVERLWLPQVVTNSVAPTPATEQLCDLPGPLPNLWGPVLEHYGATAGAFANHFAHQVHATTSSAHHAHKCGQNACWW